MSNAVLTITCPHCGGKVGGVLATNVHQTVPCTYCGTELHVPRVGEVIVREIVHERMRYPRRNAKPAAAIWLALLAMFAGVLIVMHVSASADMDEFHAREGAEQACKDSCPQQCIHAADNAPRAPETDDPELKITFANSDRVLRESAMTMCKTDCELKCIGSDVHER